MERVLPGLLFAIYGRGLVGAWRPVYVACAILALYLNVFVGVVQSFDKFAYLHKFAPNGSEPAFVATQAIVLALFVVLGVATVRRYRPRRGLTPERRPPGPRSGQEMSSG